MAQQRASVAIARILFQMVSRPMKHRLDRRYLPRDEAMLAIAVIHERLSDVRRSIRDQGVALVDANRRLARADSRLAAVSASLHASIQRLSDLDRKLGEVRSEASSGASFVSHEDPNELRKKLFDAHRLARESAEAIESLLQAELELWQALDAVDVHRSTSGPADV